MKKSFKFFLLINSIHLINWGELVAGKHLCGQLVSIYLLRSALFIALIVFSVLTTMQFINGFVIKV